MKRYFAKIGWFLLGLLGGFFGIGLLFVRYIYIHIDFSIRHAWPISEGFMNDHNHIFLLACFILPALALGGILLWLADKGRLPGTR